MHQPLGTLPYRKCVGRSILKLSRSWRTDLGGRVGPALDSTLVSSWSTSRTSLLSNHLAAALPAPGASGQSRFAPCSISNACPWTAICRPARVWYVLVKSHRASRNNSPWCFRIEWLGAATQWSSFYWPIQAMQQKEDPDSQLKDQLAMVIMTSTYWIIVSNK